MKKKKNKKFIFNTMPKAIQKETTTIIEQSPEPKKEKKIINAISVIIPVKDRSENTKKILDTLIFQKTKYYPETEIIVIENGSIEDMSFLDKYENIIVKHENITGVSHARNVGLDIAHGQYIAFIDNDDYITKDYLHQLYQIMRRTDCDWCVFPWFIDGHPVVWNINLNQPLKTSWSVMHYCYNRRILKDILFNEKLNVGEDIEWMPQIITPETKGVKLEKAIYYYTWNGNEDSLSHRFNRGELPKEKQGD